MRYDFTPDQIAWRDEIRGFIADHLTAELLNELREAGNEGKGPRARQFVLELRDRGWWGIAWPPEYGGLGRSAIDQWIFVDELEGAGAPMLPLTVTSVAPTMACSPVRFSTTNVAPRTLSVPRRARSRIVAAARNLPASGGVRSSASMSVIAATVTASTDAAQRASSRLKTSSDGPCGSSSAANQSVTLATTGVRTSHEGACTPSGGSPQSQVSPL